MKRQLLCLGLATLPIPAAANVFELFSDVCLAPMMATGAPDPGELVQIDPAEMNLRVPQSGEHVFFASQEQDYYVRVLTFADSSQCSAHHRDRQDAHLQVSDFVQTAERSGLKRREDCDQLAADGSLVAYFRTVKDGQGIVVYATSYQGPMVSWVGLTQYDYAQDC